MSPELHVTNRKDWRLWLFYTAFISLFVGQTFALDMETSQKLDKVFSDAGINGTFVLYDVTANRLVVHAPIRAEKRFIPASTFKIPNSLIGLSTGAVGSVEKENRIYSFAINIDMPNRADVAKRVEIGKVCLRTLGIL